ncbi:cell surface protein SprA [Flavobacterium sp. JP2137]|uniref:T9SS outer membrane translocon Sov/SprA n=1 Tax=Flavobacterium sp. JP2137 TaxID=3414510 RepID=UPI003D2FCC15
MNFQKRFVCPQWLWLIGLLVLTLNGRAQQTGQAADTINAKKFDVGSIALPDPKSITESYTYDPTSDRYIYTKSIDGYNIDYPLILTRKQYEDLVLKEQMRLYFMQKFNTVDGRSDPEVERDMLPRYYVNSSLFEGIFGSNTIDVKPQGSVEFDLGMRYTKQDNPSLSPKNRKVFTFDFDQRISMSLQGKVGTRLNVNANYDTQSTFDFQNLIKLEYTPDEDDILQKIEVGNVSMPISSSLIRGAQSLFGVKTQLQFGRTTFTGVFSEQKSQTRSVVAEGGGTMEEFELFGLDYDADRHFFLSQYFRSRYDESLKNYPYINSRVRITRVEVWITNRQNRVSTTDNNMRNIIAIQDLGEGRLSRINDMEIIGVNTQAYPDFIVNPQPDAPSDNKNNKFDPGKIGSNFLNSGIRTITSGAAGFNIPVTEGRDFSKLESARKLTANEFTFHPQLGYISLQQRLSNDEVLAVSYQYTIGDKVYQVGEFGSDGGDATTVIPNLDPTQSPIPSSQNLVLKMLKSNLTSVEQPLWNLMMKNIYQIPGAMQLEQQDFRFNILYTDPSPLNYISAAGADPLPPDVERTPLLRVFNLDRLNFTNDPQEGGDGFFDFVANAVGQNPMNAMGAGVGAGGLGSTGGNTGGMGNQNTGQNNFNTFEGITIDAQNGRIIFTSVEPFGTHLFNKLSQNNSEDYNFPASYNSNQRKYVFRKMYRGTQASALQEGDKNKFQLKGRYKSSMGDGIPIGAYNVPQGSVVVQAGGRLLIEGADYTVDYARGRVKILDPGLQASNTPIDISVENNAVFGQQTKRFFGFNVEHKFSDKFLLGATYLRLSEKPMTQKSSYGEESVNNTIMGMNVNYSTEVPFFTRLVNKLPNVDTDAESSISFRGEFAYLKPGSSKADQFGGEATSYIDDFEGSQSNIDVRSPQAWHLASTPVGFGDEANDLSYGYRRGKLAWYTIDPVFYASSRRPNGITEQDVSSNRTRRVFSEELFPSKDVAYGESRVINTLDLTYYPKERGPYNYNPEYATSGRFMNPDRNWGGIMRALNSTNFEQANVEFIEFWMMDPYTGNPGDVSNETNQGQVKFNLGFISEDILKDGHKQYENGLPTAGGNQPVIKTIWGKVPASTSLIYAFDTNEQNRIAQDTGLDGLSDAEEAAMFPSFANLEDPAADNYEYFLSAEGNVLERYRNYNGVERNSPVGLSGNNRGSSTLPDTEDIDGDNTMNTINAYYEFSVDVKAGLKIGENHVVDIRTSSAQLPDGSTTPVRWIQYKIPIDANEDNAVGPISDLRSVRFMRMFVTGFKDEVTLRFGTLNLVRSEWRRFDGSLIEDVNSPIKGSNVGFDVTSVNLENNFERNPIPYVTPPGVVREQVYTNNSLINQNEQSLSLKVYQRDPAIMSPSGLEPGDSKAVFKNVSVDMRQYKKLRMFIHAEALEPQGVSDRLRDDEMVAFIRFGNDFTENFYQVEIPLKLTTFGETAPDLIWMLENEIEVALDLLTKLKVLKMNDASVDPNLIYYKDEDELDGSLSGKPNKLRLGIKGSPNFGRVRTIMLGLKNQTDLLGAPRDLRGEVWFNELRMSDMENKGGWAAVANVDAQFADFANLSATGSRSTIGFGGLEQGPNERSREDLLQYNLVTNVNLGQLLPKKWGINLPFNYAIGEETITPEYDPFNPDIKLKYMKDGAKSDAERNAIQNRAEDYTKRKSINFIGVNKQRNPEKKARIYDVENLTLSHSYNEMERHDFEIEALMDQQTRTAVDYAYTFNPKPIEPFKKTAFMKKSSYWKILSDFNVNYLPSNVSFSTNILRQYNKQQYRLVDVEGIGFEPLYRRNYLFNYNYGFNYNITKSLRLSYTAGTSNIVRNYYDYNNRINNDNTIWDNYFDVGEANQHMQQFTLNYELPINKIPMLSFIKSTYSYTGDFNWQRASDAFSSVEDNGNIYHLGNTIQNANSHRLNTVFSMDKMYRYIGLVKSSDRNKKSSSAKVAALVPGQKVVRNAVAKPEEEENKGNAVTDILIGLVTSVRNIQVNYTENNGTFLPGFMPGLGFFGTSKPSLGFVFGSQSDVRYNAAKNGWLTDYPEFNQSFTQVNNKTLNVTAQMELIPDLMIDLSADRTMTQNFSEQYDVENGRYNPRAPSDFGNFTISTVLIKTAFSKSDINSSVPFDQFRDNRLVVANRLAASRGIDLSNSANLDADGFPIGYGKNNQSVLLPAFLAAYTGADASSVSTGVFRNIPLPNWNMKYTGLMKIGWFKDNFRRFSLHHGYQAGYTIGSFSSNYEYIANPDQVNDHGNYPVETIVNNATLVERFNPLVRVDFELKNAFKILAEIRKDRALSLSFDNNLLTEVSGNEYIVGFGYRIKDVSFNSDLANDGQGGRITSDINIKADFTWRKNQTIIRYLDYDNNQLGAGQDIWSFRFTSDYALSQNLTAIFFYDHTFSKAVISTTFPMTNVRAGFTMRYNF